MKKLFYLYGYTVFDLCVLFMQHVILKSCPDNINYCLIYCCYSRFYWGGNLFVSFVLFKSPFILGPSKTISQKELKESYVGSPLSLVKVIALAKRHGRKAAISDFEVCYCNISDKSLYLSLWYVGFLGPFDHVYLGNW